MERKAKFWVGILWVDSMRDDWKKSLELALQIPYVYILHDKDIAYDGSPKSPHLHLMVAYPNTTTEKCIKDMFNELSQVGSQCCNKVFPVRGVKYMYDYLIHDTELARKEKKYLYDSSERIEGLGWDTSAFNQQQITDKLAAVIELSNCVSEYNLTTYVELFKFVVANFDLSYFEILIGYSGHFDRLVKGQWQVSQR